MKASLNEARVPVYHMYQKPCLPNLGPWVPSWGKLGVQSNPETGPVWVAGRRLWSRQNDRNCQFPILVLRRRNGGLPLPSLKPSITTISFQLTGLATRGTESHKCQVYWALVNLVSTVSSRGQVCFLWHHCCKLQPM